MSKKGMDNYIMISKNGEIHQKIKETFDENYYDIEELKKMILSQAAAYNSNNNTGDISASKITVEEGDAVVDLKFADAYAYADFNEIDFYNDSIAKALDKGISFKKLILTDVNNASITISEPDIKVLTDSNILIADVDDIVMLPSRALYISDNVEVLDDGKSIVRKSGENTSLYVIY